MRGVAFTFVGAAVLIILLSSGAIAACSGTNSAASLGDEDLTRRFFLESDSATSGPHVSGDASPSTGAYQAKAQLSGLSEGLGTAQNQVPGHVEFAARGKVNETLHLNLSKPVVGAVHFRSQATTNTQRDVLRLRVELFINGVRAGGTERVFGTSELKAWQTAFLCFRPEIQRIEAGSEVSARIIRYGSLSDLEVGTHDPAQSFFEVAYFQEDPLGGTFYLEKGRLIAAPSSASEGGGAAFAVPAVLALAAVPLSDRRRAALGLLAMLLVAGCAGPGPSGGADDASSSVPPIESRSIEDPALRANGTGSIHGRVQNHVGLPIQKAHVALLGTSHFVNTDAQGSFRFERVRPDTYTMRIDAQSYTPLEERVVVELGKILIQNVTLTPPNLGSGNLREHIHDYWGDETRKLVSTREFTFTNYVDQSRGEAQQRGVFYCSGHLLCEGKVPLQEFASIIPGTGLVEVRVRWDSTSPTAPKEAGLRIITPVDGSANQHFVFRPSGDAFRVAIFPNEADPGHQKFSNWVFYLRVGSPTNTAGPFATPAYAAVGLKGTMEVFVHKAIVPLEPTHWDMWQNRTEIPIIKGVKITSACAGPVLGCGDYPYSAMSWSPPKDVFVPAGTGEIRGTLEWTHPGGAPAGTTWLLAYRPANVAAGSDLWSQATMTPISSLKSSFVIKLTPEMGDQFYQTASNWQFSPDDNEDTLKFANTGLSGATWTLTATAYRDPAWVDA